MGVRVYRYEMLRFSPASENVQNAAATPFGGISPYIAVYRGLCYKKRQQSLVYMQAFASTKLGGTIEATRGEREGCDGRNRASRAL